MALSMFIWSIIVKNGDTTITSFPMRFKGCVVIIKSEYASIKVELLLVLNNFSVIKLS